MKKLAIVAVVCVLPLTASASIEGYVGADRALAGLKRDAAPASTAATLAKDLAEFAARSSALRPDRTANDYVALVDRVLDLPMADAMALAELGGEPPSIERAMSVLPAPDSWPAIAAIWSKRAAAADHKISDETLALLGQLLLGRRDAVRKAVPDVAARIARSSGQPQVSEWLRDRLEAGLEDGGGDVAARIERIARQPVTAWDGAVAVPDVVAMLGPAKGREMMVRLLAIPDLELTAPAGSKTEVLLGELVMASVATSSSAHWTQTKAPAPSSLYEAMEAKFVPAGAAIGPSASHGPQATSFHAPATLDDARVRYVVALLAERRVESARSALRNFARVSARDGGRRDPMMDAAVEADVVLALADVVESLLAKEPLLPLWSLHRTASLRAGKGERALIALRKHVAAASPVDAVPLTADLVTLLLALDHVDEALTVLRRGIDDRGKRDPGLDVIRVDLALRLTRLGHALKRPAITDEAVRATQRLCGDSAKVSFNGRCEELWATVTRSLLTEGRGVAAERMLVARLRTTGENPYGATGPVSALVEVYGHAGRHNDVITLLQKFNGWPGTDLADLLSNGPSYGAVPLPVRAAEALNGVGRRDEAREILQSFLVARPGVEHLDRAYEGLARIDGDRLLPWLEARIADDRFEERPLIWKAQLLGERGDFKDAETAARAAIAIDPSDGEQKRGDRLRAYSVLADVLRRSGRAAEAKPIDGAILAIRAAEDADVLREAGLSARAIASYDAAVRQFADAYCIHSRAAVEMEAAGRLKDAQVHYERAFELMPSSFGRVESHCFGCEGVFDSRSARTSAERILRRITQERPSDARAHYLLGYLLKLKGDKTGASPSFQRAFELDPDYLNAWIRFAEVADEAGVSTSERERASLQIARLDPQARHNGRSRANITDLAGLYRAHALAPPTPLLPTSLLALPAAMAEIEKRAPGRSAAFRHRSRSRSMTTPGDAIAQQESVQAVLSVLQQRF